MQKLQLKPYVSHPHFSQYKNTASLKNVQTDRRILFCKTSSGEILSSTSSAAETSRSLYKAQTLTYKFRFRPRPKIFQFQVCNLTNLGVDWQFIKKLLWCNVHICPICWNIFFFIKIKNSIYWTPLADCHGISELRNVRNMRLVRE